MLTKINIKAKVVLILLLVLTIVIPSALTISSKAVSLKYDTKENLVNSYLNIMKIGAFEKNINVFSNGSVGIDPLTVGKGLSLEVAENAQTIGIHKVDILETLKNQQAFVVNSFGNDAWGNVSYVINKIDSPEVKEQWIEISTGKVLTTEEGMNQLKKYWDSVSVIENIDAKLFFKTEMDGIKEQTDEEFKIMKIKEKYTIDEPVKVKLVPYYDTYEVCFMFNNMEKSDKTGLSNFRIYISNKNGVWSIYDGLNWSYPEEAAPVSDI